MSFLIRQQRDKDDDVYHFAGNEIPRRQLKIGHDQLVLDALTLPEQALADELVQAYFTHVNPGYPIVDEDLFMAQYRNRDSSDPPPVLLLQAILLVGSHVTRSKAERDALKDRLHAAKIESGFEEEDEEMESDEDDIDDDMEGDEQRQSIQAA